MKTKQPKVPLIELFKDTDYGISIDDYYFIRFSGGIDTDTYRQYLDGSVDENEIILFITSCDMSEDIELTIKDLKQARFRSDFIVEMSGYDFRFFNIKPKSLRSARPRKKVQPAPAIYSFQHEDTDFCRVYVTCGDALYCFQEDNRNSPPILYVCRRGGEPEYPVSLPENVELDLRGCDYLKDRIEKAFKEGFYFVKPTL